VAGTYGKVEKALGGNSKTAIQALFYSHGGGDDRMAFVHA